MSKEQKPDWATDIPESVKVGYMNLAVELLTKREDEEQLKYGSCNVWNELILISPRLPKHQAAQVFLHELLHAAFHLYYAGSNTLSQEDENKWVEPFITGTARGLAGIITDNPDVMPWIQRLLQGKPKCTIQND